MTRRRDLIACSGQRVAGPAAAQSYEWSAEDLVFLSRRVRPTPSGRLTRDVHQCNMCIRLAQGAYPGSISMVATGRRFGLLIVPGHRPLISMFRRAYSNAALN
jgi:hypothetical protein